MLLSLALIFMIGLLLGELLGKIQIPKFIGMIITGILLGPYVLNLIDDSILSVSSELRTIALVVILLRAGLSLEVTDLKEIGRPAFFLSFIPALLEISIIALVAPILFDISTLEALILGTVLAAVSPAVIVPKMIQLIDNKWGHNKRIPHLILGSASIDDIFVIVLFSALIEIYGSSTINLVSILLIPVAILMGIGLGLFMGYLLSILFEKMRVRDTLKVLIILAVSFFIIGGESYIDQYIPISGLLSVMVIGISFLHQSKERGLRLRRKFDTVWVFAELMLFVLVGAEVDIRVALAAGALGLLMLVLQLAFRSIGVVISLMKTNYDVKEKLFVVVSFWPKATVQAAIGGIPLALGIISGDLILALAVFSILVTAPLGAMAIEFTYKKWLRQDQ